MSMLIKGLDMPDESGVVTLRIWGNGVVERLESYHAWLLSGVRAVPVPTPHGRLKDTDALLQRAVLLGWSTPKWVSDIAIEDAPTIIETEEGEDNG